MKQIRQPNCLVIRKSVTMKIRTSFIGAGRLAKMKLHFKQQEHTIWSEHLDTNILTVYLNCGNSFAYTTEVY